MNARQSVLIAMFIAIAVFLLAGAEPTIVQQHISSIKQKP